MAYAVLDDPGQWLCRPSVEDLQALLFGAKFVADFVDSRICSRHIFGVLDDPAFIQHLRDESGLRSEHVGWANLAAMSHFQFAEGFDWLRNSATNWHLKCGCEQRSPSNPGLNSPGTSARSNPKFWTGFVHRPAMFIGGSNAGTSLYAFLIGGTLGASWLKVDRSPEFDKIFDDIQSWSTATYGCPVSAFRCCTAIGCLNGAGYRSELSHTPAS